MDAVPGSAVDRRTV